ncbi:ABC transporter ATP-binding protein [Paracoccus sp. SCSIO 75233]|uniref:ABC transporter ATP-binding protein n=1 Tax=Paracoccus sp. SCSIO 75233 TaxID=3017782 RepID=UPI0022EFE626|nr:ABC transporter ATP-binding protein [Paracoccus sp. SCSIO 75233]WBU53936.1 ABC transporter ATP-binding protein [Paracoccus sp. SCSIO 75233]
MTDPAYPLELRDVRIGYGGKPVVDSLSLGIPRGQFTALLGPNGSGKSTILRSLAGLQRLESGTVLLDGTELARLSPKAIARRIGYLAQGAQAPEGMTVCDLVRQGRYPHRPLFGGWREEDSAAVEDALNLTSVAHLRDRRLDSLSGGQRQRAWIAMTLAQQGEVLLLDEPTTYLDLAHQIELLELLRRLVEERGNTVIAVLHDLNQASRYADRLVLLRDGRLQGEGRPEEVMTSASVLEVFGVSVTVITDPESGAPLCVPRQTQTPRMAM